MKQVVAVFLIVLVLCIPLYSAKAYADAVTSVSVYGGDNVEGYRKITDTTSFEAVVFGEDITADRVYLEENSGQYKEQFDSCVQEAVGYRCTKNIEEQEWEDNHYTFPVRLYTQNMELMSTMYAQIDTDANGPVITFFDADKNTINLDDSLEISYNVQDTAYTGCSGILKVEFYADNVLVLEKSISTESCSSQGSFDVNASELGLGEGTFALGLKAYDMLNQESEMANYMVTVDNTGPAITGNVEITKIDREPLVYVPQNGINAIMTVYVNGDDFKEARAKMIELNPAYYTYDEFIPGECLEEDDLYECIWEVNVNVDENTNANIYFELEDKTGNVNEVSKPYSLLVDNINPTITNLETNYNGVIGLKTNFTAIISETGSGFFNKNVYLNLASVGASTLQANECNSTAGGWRCYWYDVTALETAVNGPVPAIVMPSSMDDMGNYVTGVLEYNMTLDTVAPAINSLEIIPIAGSYGYPVNITEPKTGDSLLVLVNITDTTDVVGQGDFSEVVIDGNSYSVNCVGEDYKICNFETEEVIEGPATGTIYFNFTDKAGNIFSTEEDLIIYGVDNNTALGARWYVANNPNEGRMPSYIDAETTSLISYKAYFPVEIRRKYTGYIVPAEIYGFECANSTAEIGEPYLIGTVCPNCTNFYAVVPLILQNYDDSVEIKCSFDLVSIYGNIYDRRLSVPEEHNVTLVVEFEGNVLGGLDEAARNKVDAVENSALVSGGLIKTMTTINKVAEAICSVVRTIENIAATIDMIIAIVSGNLCPAFPFACSATAPSEHVTIATTISAVGLDSVNKYFCSYVTCSGWFRFGQEEGEWIDDYQNYVREWGSGSAGLDIIGAEDAADFFNESIGQTSPKDSLVLSVATLCVPGIISNLEKARQIECKYAYCMEEMVPAGMPSFACTRERAYSWCAYVYGEMFNLIPFSQFVEFVSSYIGEAISNPISAAMAVLPLTCEGLALTGTGQGAFCAYVQSSQLFLAKINDIASFISEDVQQQFGLGSEGDYCRKLEKGGYI